MEHIQSFEWDWVMLDSCTFCFVSVQRKRHYDDVEVYRGRKCVKRGGWKRGEQTNISIVQRKWEWTQNRAKEGRTYGIACNFWKIFIPVPTTTISTNVSINFISRDFDDVVAVVINDDDSNDWDEVVTLLWL